MKPTRPILFSPEDSDLLELSWVCDSQGYVCRGKQGKTIAHRVVIARMFGSAPTKGRGNPVIDHINQDKLDNRRENLRLVSRSINALNSKFSEQAKHYAEQPNGKFKAWLGRKHIGYFSSKEDAINAVSRAREAALK